MSNRTLSTPEELADYLIGKSIFRNGGFINDCKSEAMRRGFSRMANHQIDVVVGSWNTFNEQPQQAIRFSEAAFQNVAYRNERSFQGVDYLEPSLQ